MCIAVVAIVRCMPRKGAKERCVLVTSWETSISVLFHFRPQAFLNTLLSWNSLFLKLHVNKKSEQSKNQPLSY